MIPIHNKEVKSPICLICYSKNQINQKPILKVPDEFHSIFKYVKNVAEVILIPILSEGIGYGILFGVGLVIAMMVTMLARTESKWLGTKKTFGWYYTAGRNVKSWPYRCLGCLIVDMGRYHSPIIKCRISIWDKCTIVGGKYNVYIYIWSYFCSW